MTKEDLVVPFADDYWDAPDSDATVEFRHDELVLALREALAPDSGNQGGYVTTARLSEIMGLSVKTVRKRLGLLKAAGLLEVGKVMQEALNGSLKPVDAYRLKENRAGVSQPDKR